MQDDVLFRKFSGLNVSSTKLLESLKNKRIRHNLQIISENINPENLEDNLWFELASNIPIDFELEKTRKLIDFVDRGAIISSKELLRAIVLVNEDINCKLPFRNKNKKDLRKFLKTTKLDRKAVLGKIMQECEYAVVPSEIIRLVNSYISNTKIKKERNILNEGELAKLHTPFTNKQKTEKILKEHLKRTGGKVITRFPPEPNGFLHIGHAKSLFLNFGYAALHKGKCIVRFDDTNPKNEKKEYYDSIIESIKWLEYPIKEITAASDHFDKLIEFGFDLIEKGFAYICHLSSEEIKEHRENFEYSKYRDRPKKESKEIFEKMVNGEIKEGDAVLRLKQTYNKDNPLTQDLIAFRVLKEKHTRNTKHVYPSYDFTHCLNDSIEDITHSFCSREFFTRQETYYWLIDKLNLYKPVQWEFARLNISHTVLSKRKLTVLVEKNLVNGWDDPRLFTLMGLKRRGVTPSAIKDFIGQLGYTFNGEAIIDLQKFEAALRNDLKKKSRRVFGILDPLLIEIRNLETFGTIKIKDFGSEGKERVVPFSNRLFIDESDFFGCLSCKTDKCKVCEIPKDFKRLTMENPVKLLNLFPIKLIEIKRNKLIVERIPDEVFNKQTVKKYIQWVDFKRNVSIKYFMYSKLFKSFNPSEVDYLTDINYDSLNIKKGLADIRLLDCVNEERLQFDRLGYFCVDKENEKVDNKLKVYENNGFYKETEPLRLNLTILLKSSYD